MTGRVGAVLAIAAACAALVTAGYLLGGRGVRPTGVVAAGAAPAGIAQRSGQEIFLVRDERVTPVVRPGGRGSVRRSLVLLLAGPTPAERAHGYSSELPELRERRTGDRLRLRQVAYGELRIDLPGRLPPLSRRAMRQIACTVVRGLVTSGRGREAPELVVVFDGAGRRLGVGDCAERLPQVLAAPTTRLPRPAAPAPAAAPATTAPAVSPQSTRP